MPRLPSRLICSIVANQPTVALLLVGVSLFRFCSCHDTVIDDGFPAPEYFPNTVGDKWTYAVYDSVRNVADTVQVRVRGQSIIPSRVPHKYDGEAANIWEYRYKDHADTHYVNLLLDTVNVYDGQFSHQYFIIPFEVGKKWGSSYGLGGDSTTVATNDSITVSAGHFRSGFFIKRHQYTIGPVSSDDTDSWFVPEVGTVWIHQYDNLGFHNVTWALLSYEIPKREFR